MRKYIKSIIFFILLLNTCFAVKHVNAQEGSIDLEKMCEALEDLKLGDTYILSASIVPANGDLPEHCRVNGYILPAINFEIRLPTENWNGKFFMGGLWWFLWISQFWKKAENCT